MTVSIRVRGKYIRVYFREVKKCGFNIFSWFLQKNEDPCILITMNNLELTSIERKKLIKRGFFIKKNYSIRYFIETLLYSCMYVLLWSILVSMPLGLILVLFYYISEKLTIITYGIWLLLFFSPILLFIKWYLYSGSTFYSEKWIIWMWSQSFDEKNSNYKYLYFLWNFINSMKNSKEGWFWLYVWALLLCAWVFFAWAIIPILDPTTISWYAIIRSITSKIFIILAVICWIYVVFELFRHLFQLFHPLYAFWNLWEKIQKLTPEIEKQSKLIQKNFQKDMNFRVLSDGFDSLASAFSEVITLVIKLESIEQKANKWNLFDSEKYINSLRSDMLEPLKSLKIFLEKKKKELIHSQKELSRVRIGWLNELDMQSELTSKRSETLIVELMENIEKLEEMIRKMI